MQIALCDDNSIDRAVVSIMLNRFFTEKRQIFSLYQYDNTERLIFDAEDGKHFDIIFLDMYIGTTIGLDAARQLRAMHYHGDIVFLTVSPDFAVESYDVDASGYLLKPHKYQKFHEVMDQILRHYKSPSLQLKHRSAIINIPIEDIMYIDSHNSKCTVHSSSGNSYTIYRRLADIQEELSDDRFLRCHQSFLVNMDFIKIANQEFTLTNGDVVLIRKRNRKAICCQYLNYLQRKENSKGFQYKSLNESLPNN